MAMIATAVPQGKAAHKGVAAEKQIRAAARKAERQSTLIMLQGERTEHGLVADPSANVFKPTPIATALRGGKASKMLVAVEVRAAVVDLFKSTDRASVDMVQGRTGASRASKLFKLFQSSTQETVREALDLKKAGFAQGTFEYVTLSEAGTFRKAWEAGFADKLMTPVIPTETGSESSSWRERLSYARRLLKAASVVRNERAIQTEAYGRALASNAGADDAEIVAAAKQVAETLKQAQADEKATAKAERESAIVVGRKVARRIHKERGLEYLREFIRYATAETGVIAAEEKAKIAA